MLNRHLAIANKTTTKAVEQLLVHNTQSQEAIHCIVTQAWH